MTILNSLPESMDSKTFEAWQHTMAKRTKAVELPKDIDFSKVSCEIGPALTEEQFKEYCAKTGIKPHVIKK